MRPFLRPTAIATTLLLLSTPLIAQTAPEPTADQILSQARSTAAAEHKNILLAFSASWCGPCHMFEHFVADPTIAPIMNKAFVLERLDVGEHPTDTRHHDTPGAVDLRAHLGGATAGYPTSSCSTPPAIPSSTLSAPAPAAPAPAISAIRPYP